MNSIEDRIHNCIIHNGITILDDGKLDEIDSISFISLIVELEKEFEISFPDEYLLMDKFVFIDDIIQVVQILISENN